MGGKPVKKLVPLVAVAAVLAGCQPKPATKTAAAAPPKFNTELPMDEFMGHMVDPAAFMYWRGSGTEETEKGVKQLSPPKEDEEAWDNIVSGATILIAAGNELQLPGRVRAPEAHWVKYAQDLTAEAVLARAAAEKKDPKGVYDEGAKLYEVCVACHEEYVIQPEIKANGPAKGDPLPDWPADVKAKMEAYAKQHATGGK
jgi:hypothetical protein